MKVWERNRCVQRVIALQNVSLIDPIGGAILFGNEKSLVVVLVTTNVRLCVVREHVRTYWIVILRKWLTGGKKKKRINCRSPNRISPTCSAIGPLEDWTIVKWQCCYCTVKHLSTKPIQAVLERWFIQSNLIIKSPGFILLWFKLLFTTIPMTAARNTQTQMHAHTHTQREIEREGGGGRWLHELQSSNRAAQESGIHVFTVQLKC